MTKAFTLFEEPMVLFRTSLCFGSKIYLSPPNQGNLDEVSCKKIMNLLKMVIKYDESMQDIINYCHIKEVFNSEVCEGSFLGIILQLADSVTKILNKESMKELASEVNLLQSTLHINIDNCNKKNAFKVFSGGDIAVGHG